MTKSWLLFWPLHSGVMMRSVDSGKKFVRAHQLLADRAIERDIPGSQAMLEAHLRSTLNFVYPPGSES